MVEAGALQLKSLRQQVYDHLRRAINRGELEPGSHLDLNRMSEELGISRTPLRDALLQLDLEGFVSVLPRRGVVVSELTLDDVRHIYEIIGALEGAALVTVFPRLDGARVKRLSSLNREMRRAVLAGDFDTYYQRNLAFHDVFLELSDNETLVRQVEVLKQRLYDFPRRKRFSQRWEMASTGEHAELIALVERGDARGAGDYLRDVHWSFDVQRPFILEYYFGGREPGEHVGGGNER